jgi:hypothetical protein
VNSVAQPAFIGSLHLRVGPSRCGGYPSFKPSDEPKGGAFPTITISELNETISLDLVYSLPCLSYDQSMLLLGAAALLGPMGSCCSEPIWCKPQWGMFYFIHRQLLPLLVKTLCK